MAGEFFKIYKEQGGAKEVVASGGEVEYQSGSTLDIQSGTTVTNAGTETLSGTHAVSGAASISSGGSLTFDSGSKVVHQLQTKATNYTVLASESGATFIGSAADVVFTLPATAAGLVYRFVTGAVSAGTGLSVSPAAVDKIMGSCDGVSITAAADKDLINTGATDVLGDSITLIGDGVDGWYIIGSTGVWAREA